MIPEKPRQFIEFLRDPTNPPPLAVDQMDFQRGDRWPVQSPRSLPSRFSQCRMQTYHP